MIFLGLQEIYAIKLPGNPKLGEGKPENQNHAIVFTRGNAVQTIDMNQVINWLYPFKSWSIKLGRNMEKVYCRSLMLQVD